jgi:Tfp pilus assembly protein PilX
MRASPATSPKVEIQKMYNKQRLPLKPVTGHNAQRGAALAVSLILLTALTVIGVSVLNSSGLQERMAANSQEKLAAFQAAESGVANVIETNADFGVDDVHTDPDGLVAASMYHNSSERAKYTASRCYLQETPPPRGNRAVSQNSKLKHFDVLSEGETVGTNGKAAVHQGVYILIHNSGGQGVHRRGGDTATLQGICMQQGPADFDLSNI